jgi:plastocyanin
MKFFFLLQILLILLSFTGSGKTWTITNSGTTFSPESITINVGDSVKFSISSSHNSVEVSQSTWNTNGNTPLTGFSTPYG